MRDQRMPKCKACGSANVNREHSAIDYLWIYKCGDCGHWWLKTIYDAPGIREGPLAQKHGGTQE